MLFKIKDRFKQIVYYDNDDFIKIINKITDMKKNHDYIDYIHSVFLSIDSVAKTSFINKDKNMVLLKVNEKRIKNATNTHTVKYYKLLYDNRLIWIESYYIEKF